MGTKENVLAAFAGESQANRKYLAFAKKAETENKTLKQAALELGIVTNDEFDQWVDPAKMTMP